MTIWYPDCSNNQWSSDEEVINFLEQLVPEGFSAMCHKVSEGNYYEDPYWPTVLQWCQQNNLLVIGYHYVTTNDAAQQAQTYLSNVGDPSVPCMLDFEANSGDITNFWSAVDAFNAAGVQIALSYIPAWYFEEIGSPDLTGVPGLVSSGYPIASSGYASTLYYEGGGDTGEGWAPYGNVSPSVWQFTDQALIAGINVDCNAFLGTVADLQVLLTGGTVTQPDPTVLSVVQDNQTQLRGPNLAGWPQLGGHPVVDAIAVIGQALGIPGFAPPDAS